ncbi:MAG: PilZ domain-containing protein [Syntrophobacteraceae bacterium]
MEEEKYRKAREYSRVDAHLPLQVRVVPAEEEKELRSRTSNECMGSLSQPIPDLEDRVLAECMRIINSKLDTILNILNMQGPGSPALQTTKLNISGNGLNFESDGHYENGDIVEVKLMLPYLSDSIFYIYGDVVRVEKISNDRFNISIRFTAIDEDIREKIVKFVFEKQREIIRKQRRL